MVGTSVRAVSDYTYDGKSRVTEYACGMAGATGGTLGQTYGYTYNDTNGTLSSMTVTASGVSDTMSFTYDALQRLTAKNTVRTGLTLAQEYSYKTVSGNRTSSLISGVTQKVNGTTLDSYTYTYDSLGNITAINRNGTGSSYVYDVQNQLTVSAEGYISYQYTYDTYGNILSVKKYDNEDEQILLSTDTYTYGDSQWLDRLTAFNGVSITYDGIGNPLSYYNGSSYTFTWDGRELATAVKGGVTTTYKYGADGLRTRKKVGSTVYDYYYADGLLVRQTWGSNYMDFLYDESGSAYSFIYNGTQYYYVKNLQGDVVKILNTSGTVVATYTYDAWGKVSYSGSIGQINPIRYRGYYYDTDTGFYYLQSRYYDPVVKRFISADDASLLGANGDFASLNLYAYCGNNPVSRSDDGGEAWHILIGAGVGAISSFVASVATQLTTKRKVDLDEAFVSAGCGAITGALVAACPGAAPYISGAMGVVESLVDDCLMSDEKISPKEIASNAIISGAFGLITGTWDNDIVDNKALIDNSIHSLKNVLFSGVNPGVRKTSTKLVRKFNRFIVKTSWDSIKEGVALSFLTEGTKQIAKVIP